VADDLQCIVDPREEEDLGFLLPRNGMVGGAPMAIAGLASWAAVACFGCQGRKLLLSPFLFMFSFLCFIFHI
jgi:hypothetical protein